MMAMGWDNGLQQLVAGGTVLIRRRRAHASAARFA